MLDIKTLKSLDIEVLCLDVTNKGETTHYFLHELLETLELSSITTLLMIDQLLKGESYMINAGTLDEYVVKLRGVIERKSDSWDEQPYV